jgi:putative phage-related membrane protein|nr:MAG TPA: zonular occludens toxin [Inoviridae sp.]
MAISAYVGVPGSGKSYEVVKSVILPAIQSGRRVVSNVYGLNEEKIHQYLLKNNRKLREEQLGELIYVSNEQCLDPNFLPSMEEQDTFCKAGDLIVIDEVWRIWGSDKDIPKNHRSFIAEHRHFSHPDTGITCDLVVINQDVAQIPRFIKDRIETTYRMQKHVSLGFRNRYRVDVFQGVKLFKSNRMNYYQEKYDNEIFELYKSYESTNAKESVTDKRQSIFSSKKILLYMVITPVVIAVSAYFVYDYFNQYMQPEQKNNQIQQSQGMSSGTVDSQVNVQPKIIKTLSTKWRITGELKKEGKDYVVLSDNQGRLRLEPRSSFLFSGRMLQGEIDNQIVNYYSGEMK